MLVFSMNIFGQVRESYSIPTELRKHLDEIGVDDSTILNSYKSDFLDEVFKDSLKMIDFIGKRIGFFKDGDAKAQRVFLNTENTELTEFLSFFFVPSVFVKKQKLCVFASLRLKNVSII